MEVQVLQRSVLGSMKQLWRRQHPLGYAIGEEHMATGEWPNPIVEQSRMAVGESTDGRCGTQGDCK